MIKRQQIVCDAFKCRRRRLGTVCRKKFGSTDSDFPVFTLFWLRVEMACSGQIGAAPAEHSTQIYRMRRNIGSPLF
jgi:hypothetical protein